MTKNSSSVPVTGNTFPVKDQIKAMGGKWNADSKCWMVPAAKAAAAQALVSGAGPKQPYAKKATAARKPAAPKAPERASLTLEEYTALAASQGRTVLMKDAPGHGGQTLMFNRQVNKGETVENGEIINHSKYGRLMVIHCTRPFYMSEDAIEEHDAWHDYKGGRGWYVSYTVVRVTDSPAEIAAAAAKVKAEEDAKAAAEQEVIDKAARIKANEPRLLEIIEMVKASPVTGGSGGMMTLWGEYGGPRLLGFDGGLLWVESGSHGQYLDGSALAAEAFKLAEMVYKELM